MYAATLQSVLDEAVNNTVCWTDPVCTPCMTPTNKDTSTDNTPSGTSDSNTTSTHQHTAYIKDSKGKPVKTKVKADSELARKCAYIRSLVNTLKNMVFISIERNNHMKNNEKIATAFEKKLKFLQQQINNFVSTKQTYQIKVNFDYSTQKDSESKTQYKKRIMDNEMTQYINKTKAPTTTLPVNWKNCTQAEIVYSLHCISNSFHSYQYKLISKYRQFSNNFHIEKDLQKLKGDPYYLYTMLRKKTNKAFLHKLDYIIKDKGNNKFSVLSHWKDVFQEVQQTYENIFNNCTTFSPDKQHWFNNLPQVNSEDHHYLNANFSKEELIAAIKGMAPFSAGGTDNIIGKMIQLLIEGSVPIETHLLNFYNSIK
jgi:hypothetical protein